MYWALPLHWSLTFWESFLGTADHVTTPLDADDAEAAAALHGQAFAQAWSGEEFAALLSQDGVFGYAARRRGAPHAPPVGIVLARLTIDEGEILTIAVDPAQRGRGVGRLLMDEVLSHLHRERALGLFLEVDETNEPALKLYRRLRFTEVGRRPAYYLGSNGVRTSALTLKRTLRS